MAKSSKRIERLQTSIDLGPIANLSSPAPAGSAGWTGSEPGLLGWPAGEEQPTVPPPAPGPLAERRSTTWR